MSCNCGLHYERERVPSGVYNQYIHEIITLVDGPSNAPEIIGHIKFAILEDRKEVWISEIIIEPNYRGRGYGRQLIQMVKVVATVAGLPIHLAAHPDVVVFYNMCGFRTIEKGDKTSPIDIMEWSSNGRR